jgi:hypothetical protein
MTRRVNKIWKRKSKVPNKKDDEYIAPESDDVYNRSLVGETSNEEYSQDKDKESSGAHNNDVDDESPTLERQVELSVDYLRDLPILF